MNFKPMADRILVRQTESETKTASGFIIPDALVEKSNTGTVVAVGTGRTTKNGQIISVPVKVNDRIIFIPDAGIKVKVDGVELLVLKEDELVAILN